MKLQLRSLLFVVPLVITAVASAQERRPPTSGDNTGPDAVGFRKDSVTNETVGDRRAPAKTPTTKQAIDDFMQLQKVNRKIQDISKAQPLVFDDLATAAKDVNARATRLRASLSLPNLKDEKKDEIIPASSNDELMSLVKVLDENVHAFVTNPRFRNTQPADKDASTQAKEASENLRKVIDASHALRSEEHT